MRYSNEDKLSILVTLRYDLLTERRHWNNKLANERMRYVKWLRKIEPIDKDLRDLDMTYYELSLYGKIVTTKLERFNKLWENK